MTELTIGRLAEEAGVNVETIRYHQRRGLMPEPDKPTQGHRRYDSGLRHLVITDRLALGAGADDTGSDRPADCRDANGGGFRSPTRKEVSNVLPHS